MDKFCAAVLKAETITRGSFGQAVTEESEKKVFGETASISQSEFSTAGQKGLKPSLKFVIWDFEYSGECAVTIDGDPYTVYRTYRRDDGKIELYLERRRGDV